MATKTLALWPPLPWDYGHSLYPSFALKRLQDNARKSPVKATGILPLVYACRQSTVLWSSPLVQVYELVFIVWKDSKKVTLRRLKVKWLVLCHWSTSLQSTALWSSPLVWVYELTILFAVFYSRRAQVGKQHQGYRHTKHYYDHHSFFESMNLPISLSCFILAVRRSLNNVGEEFRWGDQLLSAGEYKTQNTDSPTISFYESLNHTLIQFLLRIDSAITPQTVKAKVFRLMI